MGKEVEVSVAKKKRLSKLDDLFRVDRMIKRKGWIVCMDNGTGWPEIYFDKKEAQKYLESKERWGRVSWSIKPATIFIHVKGKTPKKS